MVENTKPGKMLVTQIPEKAEVRFRGTGRSLIATRVFSQARLHLDLSQIISSHIFILSAEMVKFPAGLKIRALEIIHPTTINIKLEDIVMKKVPIYPQTEIQTRPGFVLVGFVKTEPDSVMVKGPRSVVEKLESIPTEPVKYTDLRRNLMQEVSLNTVSPLLTVSSKEVRLIAEVERVTEVVFNDIPVKVKGVPRKLKVRVEPVGVRIMVRGAVNIIKQLKPDSIKAEVDFPLRKRKPGLAPKIILPQDIELVEVKPDSVHIVLIEE
jgi:YbbR domain-containing protein